MHDPNQPPAWNEDDRLAELRALQILDSDVETSFDEITAIATLVLGVPISLISLLDESRQWFKSARGTELRQTPREIAFCDVAIRVTSDVMVVDDAAVDERFCDNPLVRSGPRLRFYAGAPLVTRRGNPLGTLCVLDSQPRTLSADQQRILRLLADQVTRLIEYRDLSQRLMITRDAAHAERSLVEAITRHAGSGIALYDENGNCILANEAMCQVTGGSQAELLAQNIHRIDSWREAGIYDCAMRCLRSGQPQQMSAQIRRSSFGARDQRLHISFATFQQGGLDRLILVLTNLTELEKSRERAQIMQARLIDHMIDGLLLGRSDTGQVLMASAAAADELGYEAQEIARLHRTDVVDVDDPRLERFLARRRSEGSARGQLRMRRRNGSLFEAEISSALFESLDGIPLSSTVFRDITERQRLEAALTRQSEMFRTLAEHVPGMLFQYRVYPDGRAHFPFSSEGIERVYGVRADQVVQNSSLVRERILEEDRPAVLESIRVSAEKLQRWQHEYRVRLPSRGVRWLRGDSQPQLLADGSVLWHGYIQDITDGKEAEQRTAYLAYYDALTGLPNRALLMDRLRMAIAHTDRTQVSGAALFVDLDRFKQINDARGHSTGDKVLTQVAQRLAGSIRASDTVARLGGDEFVVLLSDLSPVPEAAAARALDIAENALELLRAPFGIDGSSYVVSASIGIALFAHGSPGVDDVLSQADIAMYRAKAAGRNRAALFQATMQDEAHRTLLLDHGLRQALERRELRIEIQSQVDSLGRVSGGECLLRWQHPQLGLVPPTTFIPIAEDNGSIVSIGAWVLEQACLVLSALARAGHAQDISVNLSVKQLQDERFLQMVREVIERTGAPAERLIFEVTESLFIHDLEATCSLLNEITRLGVQISIDDFGTGYSSLRYLQRLPIHELKVDRSFVDDLPHDEGDATIVRVIVAMARQLGLRLVAEGVETAEQAQWLRAVGCTSMQGWHFARAVPLDEWFTALTSAPAGG